ncbi:MAG TPA: hypothetical protein VFH74_00365 [Gaiellales bacterium]|nr:hypothetical protein [Gaiellales bacterium]
MSYGTLLFLHVLSAFALVTSVGIMVAIALALRGGRQTGAASSLVPLAGVLAAIGGLGTIVFGIWLAVHVSGYSLTNGWIIAAIVLWFVGAGLSGRISAGYRRARADGTLAVDSTTFMTHLLLVLVVAAILIDMVYKPGAS